MNQKTMLKVKSEIVLATKFLSNFLIDFLWEKKTFLAVLAILTLLTGCFKSENTNTVSTDGSTSMEKVIGILGEVFTENNKGVNFTYNPTGSGESLRYSDNLLWIFIKLSCKTNYCSIEQIKS